MNEVVAEVSEAAKAAEALAAALMQPQTAHELLDVLPAAIYTTDADGRITYYNEAAAALWGCRPRLNSDQWCGSWRLYRPDGTPLPHDQCPMAVALKEERPIKGAEAIAERPDGTRVPFVAFPTPLYDASGTLVGAVNMLVDLGEHASAERAAHRLVAIVESSDDAIVSKDLNGLISTWNKGAERLFGYFAEEIVGKPITTIIPADRQDEETGILERIRRGERVEHFETVRQRKDGQLVNISLTVSPIFDNSGKIIGASKIARDITDRKRREEQITLLAREADHRTKNLLALAQATVHLSQGETPDELKAAIEGRLRALAHAHALLARSRWAGADLHALVTEELLPYCQDDPDRARIEGPSLMLEQQAAQAMAVAVHELTTNAVKYGALSTPKGRVSVEWSCDPGRRLTFRWTETGGPPAGLPKRQGFGARVMERIIRAQFNGELKFDWRNEGVVCEIIIDT
jgi:two-component system CheB/CheR fusion protein